MAPTAPQDVKHYCRKCAEPFWSSGTTRSRSAKRSAHGRLMAHITSAHGFLPVAACHSNCSFKATFEETNTGQMLYGPGAR